MELNISNTLENTDMEIVKKQNNFLESNIGKIINTGFDVGIRFLLPDLIEDEVIEIKNAIIKEGFKEGINTMIKEAMNIGKSVMGIFTGKFENIEQMQKAVETGGIIDSLSTGINFALNKLNENGKINNKILHVITKGKNLILDNISTNIEQMITKQGNKIESFKKSILEWNKGLKNEDFSTMEKEMIKIKKYLKEVVPIENIIKDARKIENMHNVIKNNNGNFKINKVQLETASILV